MKKVGGTHVENMVRQDKYSPQKVVSEIQEIARVAERIIVIDSLMKKIASLANLYSIRAVEVALAGDANKDLLPAAHEASKLVPFFCEQSRAIEIMFTEIKECLGKISYSTNSFLDFFEIEGVRTAGASGTEQLDKAAEVINELARMNEDFSYLVQSVSRFKVDKRGVLTEIQITAQK